MARANNQRFEIDAPLGQGRFGQVVAARERLADGATRRVALRQLSGRAATDPRLAAYFDQEMKLGRLLQHPGALQVLDVVEAQGGRSVVMEYVDGLELDKLMDLFHQRDLLLPAGLAVEITRQLCETLAYAHRVCEADGSPLNLIHRTLHPAAVLLSSGGEVKLGDFGGAATRLQPAGNRAGTRQGPPWYLAPEQAAEDLLDNSVDQYAAGLILLEMLIGEPVYGGGPNLTQRVALGDVRDALEALAQRCQASSPSDPCPVALHRVVARALAANPLERFTDQLALSQALAGVLRELPFPAPLGEVVKAIKRHPEDVTRYCAGALPAVEEGADQPTVEVARPTPAQLQAARAQLGPGAGGRKVAEPRSDARTDIDDLARAVQEFRKSREGDPSARRGRQTVVVDLEAERDQPTVETEREPPTVETPRLGPAPRAVLLSPPTVSSARRGREPELSDAQEAGPTSIATFPRLGASPPAEVTVEGGIPLWVNSGEVPVRPERVSVSLLKESVARPPGRSSPASGAPAPAPAAPAPEGEVPAPTSPSPAPLPAASEAPQRARTAPPPPEPALPPPPEAAAQVDEFDFPSPEEKPPAATGKGFDFARLLGGLGSALSALLGVIVGLGLAFAHRVPSLPEVAPPVTQVAAGPSSAGDLIVTVSPPGAELRVDGKVVPGPSPYRLAGLEVGRPILVTASAPGHLPTSRTLTPRGGEATLELVLEVGEAPPASAPTTARGGRAPAPTEQALENPAYLSIRTLPNKADVFVDGVRRGSSNGARVAVPSGRIEVVLRDKVSMKARVLNLQLEPGQTREATYDMIEGAFVGP